MKKTKPLSHRAALKRIKELEETIKLMRAEERDRRVALLEALGIPSDIDDFVSRLEDLEARFW